MSARRLLFAQLFVLLPLTLATWAAVTYVLYWRIWWIDFPLHILGGAWAGLCGAWVTAEGGKRPTLLTCLLFTLFAGVAWEIFEYSEGLTMPQYMSYSLDTMKDLLMDLLGGFGGWLVAGRLFTEDGEK